MYKQLTIFERYRIRELKSMRYKIKKIAEDLGRHPSTIYRELNRNRDERGFYYPRKAHGYAKERCKDNGLRALRISYVIWSYIEYKLEKQWSSEQFCRRES